MPTETKMKKEIKMKKEEAPKKVYVYDEEVHPAGEKEPRRIQLTKQDLNPRNDKVLGKLYVLFESAEFKPYLRIPGIVGIKQALDWNKDTIQTGFENYKKRGRI